MLRLRSFAIENNGEQTADRCLISHIDKINSIIVFVKKNRVTDNEILTHPNFSLIVDFWSITIFFANKLAVAHDRQPWETFGIQNYSTLIYIENEKS